MKPIWQKSDGFFYVKQFGRGYGDGRICKILAGEFKSHVSHKMFRSSSGRTSPFQGEGHGFESRTEYKINWKVGEWLKPADCKSAPLRVRRFESVPSN